MKRLNTIALVAITSISLFACSNTTKNEEAVQDNTVTSNTVQTESKAINNKNVTEIKEIFDKNDKDTIFIDVREPFEWADGVIPNAQKISLGNLGNELSKLDKNKNYVLVCRSGSRSSKAYKQMQEAGFSNLTNLDGGMMDWYAKNYPINK